MIRFIVFTIFILPVISFSQNQCGYDFYQKDQIETNPTFEQSIQKRDKDIYNYLTSTNLSKSIDTFGVLHIPVVVHILHFDGDSIIGTGTNITDNKVIDGISELNKAFRNDSAYDSLVGVNVEIQFYLAQVDTCGNPTNGINRIAQSPFVGGGNSFSNATRHSWDPYLYFNIYLVDHISLNGNSYGGLAMGAFGSQLNAVYIVKSYFGYSSGNLSAHEAGHYLSLAHTWINGCKNDNCLLDGDKVCDTPPDNHFNFPYASCNNPGNSCYTDTADTSANNPFRPITLGGIGDQLDQISNYMDYSSSACQIQFTQGQKERMRANLLTEKTTLLGHHANANNCNIPICPYFEISSTGYHYNDFVNEGDTISFNNLSTGATNYHWYIGDSLYSNAQDTIWKPTIPGYHTIKLCGFNSDSNCTRCVFKRLNVNCSAPNAASADKNTLNAGDTVQFSAVHPAQIFPNTTHSFNWYLDSVLISSDTNFTHIFNQPGTYQVRLDVCNTNCCNSRTLTIVVTCNSNIKINAISDTYLNPGDSLKLISNSTSAHQADWYWDNLLIGSGQTFQDLAYTSGAHWIMLEEDYGTCTDSAFILVQVEGCNRSEGQNWVFGKHNWLSIRDSLQLKQDAISDRNSASTISSIDGDLLLYGDGINVYNSFHKKVAGPTNIISDADTRGSLLIRKPGSGNNFYHIKNTGWGSFVLSEIDLGQNHKNGLSLYSNILVTGQKTRAITAYDHCNQRDKWLIFRHRDKDIIDSYIINDSGVVSSPVSSRVFNRDESISIGNIKIASNGQKLAYHPTNPFYSKGLYLCKFNPTTGAASEGLFLDSLTLYLDVEFSPNGRYLYAVSDSNIYQYELNVWSDSVIQNSRKVLASNDFYFRQAQIALDHKIYVGAFSRKFGIINLPDTNATNVDFTVDTTSIASYSGSLPNFNQSYFANYSDSLVMNSEKDSICANSDLFVPIHSSKCNFGDFDSEFSNGGQINLITDTGVFISSPNKGTNTFKLSYFGICDTLQDSVSFLVLTAPTVDLGNDTTICDYDSLLLSGGSGSGHSYLWNTGDTASTIFTDTSSVYWLNISNGQCTNSDTIVVTTILCPVGIQDEQTAQGFIIFPNPSSDIFNIVYTGEDKYDLKVYNTQNQLIIQESNVNRNHQIDLSNRSAGIYFVNLQTSEKSSKVLKLIKEY